MGERPRSTRVNATIHSTWATANPPTIARNSASSGTSRGSESPTQLAASAPSAQGQAGPRSSRGSTSNTSASAGMSRTCDHAPAVADPAASAAR